MMPQRTPPSTASAERVGASRHVGYWGSFVFFNSGTIGWVVAVATAPELSRSWRRISPEAPEAPEAPDGLYGNVTSWLPTAAASGSQTEMVLPLSDHTRPVGTPSLLVLPV